MTVFRNYDLTTQVLAASIRTQPFLSAAMLGADAARCANRALRTCESPLTEIGLAKFLEDWKTR
jgi:hypothetical protein